MTNRFKFPSECLIICAFFISMFLFTFLLGYIAGLWTHLSPSVKLCEFQDCNIRTLNCSKVTFYNAGRGLTGFTVVFNTNYKATNVSKAPMASDDRLMKVGQNVIWHGIYNTEEMKDLPNSTITFTITRTENTSESLILDLKCPELDIMLLKQSLNLWKNKCHELASPSADIVDYTIYSDLHELECHDVKAVNSYAGFGSVDFSVTFPNPFWMATKNVVKHPMSKNDEFIISDKEIFWYGSSTRGGLGMTQSLMSFQLKNSSHRHYFKLSCPSVESQVQGLFREEWDEYIHRSISLNSFGMFLVSLFVLLCGAFIGDYIAIKAANEA